MDTLDGLDTPIEGTEAMTDDQLAAWRAAVAARIRAKRTRRGRRRNPYRNAQPVRLVLPPTHTDHHEPDHEHTE